MIIFEYDHLKKAVLYMLFMFVSFGIMMVAGTCDVNKNPFSTDKKEWTFLLYDDEDFDGAFGRFYDFSRTFCSTRNLNVLVLYDSRNGSARLYYIGENYQRLFLEDLGEVNMGDASTLYNFIAYAKQNYPAERIMLSLYDHGAGWVGACWDQTNDWDWLTPDEIRSAIEQAYGVDMLLFTGTCLMGAVEMAWEVRNLTDVFIASENRHSYSFWNAAFEDIHAALNRTPDIGTAALAEIIVDLVWQHSDDVLTFQPELTLSAVRLDRMAALVDALDALSAQYLQNAASFRARLSGVLNRIRSYRGQSVDVYDLANTLLSVETDSLTRTKLENVKARLSEAIIAECHGSQMSGSYGLSVYLPTEEPYNLMYRDPQLGLDFTARTRWDELLLDYFSSMENRINQEIPWPPTRMFEIEK